MSSTLAERPVLIVEDNRKTSFLLSTYLAREGFKTVLAYEGRQALDLARQHDPIFTILDLLLPKVDGWEVCEELRRASDVPILILTGRGDAHDRIMGLKRGADDYVVKPFSPREVVARVNAILRRRRPDTPKAKSLLSHDGLVLDMHKRTVTLRGGRVCVTSSEFTLLQALMAAPGRIFLREELLNHLNPTGGVVDRVIDVHIGKLRQKVEEEPAKPRYILSSRGLGYEFAESVGVVQPAAPAGASKRLSERSSADAIKRARVKHSVRDVHLIRSSRASQ